jgi:hypothetical protein
MRYLAKGVRKKETNLLELHGAFIIRTTSIILINS